MLEYIQGILRVKKGEYIVVDVGGIGYRISVPLSVLERIGELEKEVRLFIYPYLSLSGKSASIKLYGFLSSEEKELFISLLSISGIGPRIALAILSGSSPDDLQKAIAKGNYQILSRIPGIGKKTAQRIILELKEKVELPKLEKEEDIERDAVSALVSLGYKKQRAQEMVSKVLRKQSSEEIELEKIIREALCQCVQ